MPDMLDFHTKPDKQESSSSNSVETAADFCISPRSVVGYDQEEVANMFGSHDWKVDYASPHGSKGSLIHFHCIRCDAEGFATVISKRAAKQKSQKVLSQSLGKA